MDYNLLQNPPKNPSEKGWLEVLRFYEYQPDAEDEYNLNRAPRLKAKFAEYEEFLRSNYTTPDKYPESEYLRRMEEMCRLKDQTPLDEEMDRTFYRWYDRLLTNMNILTGFKPIPISELFPKSKEEEELKVDLDPIHMKKCLKMLVESGLDCPVMPYLKAQLEREEKEEEEQKKKEAEEKAQQEKEKEESSEKSQTHPVSVGPVKKIRIEVGSTSKEGMTKMMKEGGSGKLIIK